MRIQRVEPVYRASTSNKYSRERENTKDRDSDFKEKLNQVKKKGKR